jgi:WD40 repeat protein
LQYVWAVQWNHKLPNVFASGSQDKTVRLWDDRKNDATSVIAAEHPVFNLAFSQFNEFSLALALKNGAIQILDTRNASQAVSQTVKWDECRN